MSSITDNLKTSEYYNSDSVLNWMLLEIQSIVLRDTMLQYTYQRVDFGFRDLNREMFFFAYTSHLNNTEKEEKQIYNWHQWNLTRLGALKTFASWIQPFVCGHNFFCLSSFVCSSVCIQLKITSICNFQYFFVFQFVCS